MQITKKSTQSTTSPNTPKINQYPDYADLGASIHDANIVLGMIEIDKKNIDSAKKFLLNSINSEKSVLLEIYGPNMMLAKALLEAGEKVVVINYLESLKEIWIDNDGRINSWIAAIKGGGMPYFGNNLLY